MEQPIKKNTNLQILFFLLKLILRKIAKLLFQEGSFRVDPTNVVAIIITIL
jgi:hypothetical protein